MAVKAMVGSRVPPEWAEEIQSIAQEKGITPSAVVYDAIALYLEKPGLSSVHTHEQRITALENRLDRLSR